jgi:hypothetical protein
MQFTLKELEDISLRARCQTNFHMSMSNMVWYNLAVAADYARLYLLDQQKETPLSADEQKVYYIDIDRLTEEEREAYLKRRQQRDYMARMKNAIRDKDD